MTITIVSDYVTVDNSAAVAAITSGTLALTIGDVLTAELIADDNANFGTPTISNSGSALAWTNIATTNTNGNVKVAAWWALLADGTDRTVTLNGSAAPSGTTRRLHCKVHTGAHQTNPVPIGNVFSGVGTTDVSQSITPTAAGSALHLAVGDWSAGNTFAAGANCTLDAAFNDTGQMSSTLVRPTTQPRTDANAFTIGETDTAGTIAWIAFEVQAAGDGSTPLTRNLPSFVAKGTFSGLATAPTPGMPVFNDGDLLVIAIESANQAIATPSGYTQFASSPQSTGTAATAGGVRLAAFWKIAVAGDTAPTIADSGNHTCAQIYSIRGIDSGSPVNITAGTTQAATTSVSFPTVTTTTDNCLILLLLANDRDIDGTTNISAQANAALASITEQHDECIAAGVGGGLCTTTAIKLLAGAVGATTATNAASVTNATLTIALQGSPKIPDWTITQKSTPLRM